MSILDWFLRRKKQEKQTIYSLRCNQCGNPMPDSKANRKWGICKSCRREKQRSQKKTLRVLRGTPEWENEVIKCEGCGHEIGTRKAIRKAAEERGWQASQFLGLRTPCPFCGRQLWITL